MMVILPVFRPDCLSGSANTISFSTALLTPADMPTATSEPDRPTTSPPRCRVFFAVCLNQLQEASDSVASRRIRYLMVAKYGYARFPELFPVPEGCTYRLGAARCASST